MNIPVRVVRPSEYGAVQSAAQGRTYPGGADSPQAGRATPELETPEGMPGGAPDGDEEWHDRALRLQAEMENYRKRQQRLAQEQAEAERQRLLGAFLQVVDDLERALTAPPGDSENLRQGIQLTHQEALQLLKREGAEPIEAVGQLFDPNWHEAVATVGSNGVGGGPGTVARVIKTGYRLGDRLLRPAKVVVAV